MDEPRRPTPETTLGNTARKLAERLHRAEKKADDVNPWHRTLRATPEPVGNRWQFQPKPVDQ